MTAVDIARIINETKDGVDRSVFGPLFQYPDPQDVTNKQVNQLAFNVFITALTINLRGENDRLGRTAKA